MGDQRLPRRAGRGRPRPGPDRPAPRLEHAQPGLRVRLLPRRPAPGQPVRAAGRRRSATSTSGSSASSPTASASSLTRYSWLLFRGEVEAAVRELMRWLAPTAATDADEARRRLIRLHQAFLYDTVAERSRATTGAPGPALRPTENPYSKLAVDILETVRVQALTLSPSIVAYLKMLVTLGTLRHQLAVEYDLPVNVRNFIRRLARQQSLALLDPRRTLRSPLRGVRPDAARARLRGVPRGAAAGDPRGRGVAVRVPPQDAVARAGGSSGSGCRSSWSAPRSTSSLPSRTTPDGSCPREMDYTWVHVGLLVVLVYLLSTLIRNVRGWAARTSSMRVGAGPRARANGRSTLTDMDTAAGEGLRRRRTGGRAGHERQPAAAAAAVGPAADALRARPRSSPPTSSSRSTSRRCGSCPRSGWTSSTPRRARCSEGGRARRPTPTRSASGSIRTWSPRRSRRRPSHVHAARAEPGARPPARRRLDGVRDGRQPAERRRPRPRAADRQPRGLPEPAAPRRSC